MNRDHQVAVLWGLLRGSMPGAMLGALASVLTGDSISLVIPTWLPLIGGRLVLDASVLVTWAAAGAVVLGGGFARIAYRQCQHQQNELRRRFGDNPEQHHE